MIYLNAASTMKSMIDNANAELLSTGTEIAKSHNKMMIQYSDGEVQTIIMDSFSDDFVKAKLDEKETESFVITDLATMNDNGKELTYLLYKGYHNKMDKGMVYFQPVNKDTFEAIGNLQFSNMEENLFYSVEVSDAEESSCNALETGNKDEEKYTKSIVFLIGHMDEKRLLYDIERLIIDTVSNVYKHTKATFKFIVSITHFGGTSSDTLKAGVSAIQKFTEENIYSQFPNSVFEFVFEKDGTLG